MNTIPSAWTDTAWRGVACRYEAIFHCVHFMFREDELEPPLYLEADTGRLSQSIRSVT